MPERLNFRGNRLENATSVGWYDYSLSYFDGEWVWSIRKFKPQSDV